MTGMQEFWDERAREDAFYFVDNRLEYRSPDTERFWAGGEEDLMALLGALDVEVTSDDAVVDVGCGVGRLTRPLAAMAARVLAIDVSDEMLSQARELNPELENVEWILGDGSSLAPIADASADACVSHVVFQHIPDPEVTLGYVREMGRVLRPGGWAAFQVSNDPEIHRAEAHGGTLARSARRVGAAVGRSPRGTEDAEWLGSAVGLPALEAAASDGGMDVEKVVGEGTQFCLVRTRRREAADG
jgi:SAM-dependent methyltransferase